MSKDWWQRKLGQPQQPYAPQQQPVYAPQQPVYAPQPPPGPQWMPPQTPQGYPQAPPQNVDTSQIQVTPDNVIQLALNVPWQGKGTKTETEACPECGGSQYFSRTNTESGARYLRNPPAPHCWDCGYPNIQFGSRTGAGAGAKAVGPVKLAAQVGKPQWDARSQTFQ